MRDIFRLITSLLLLLSAEQALACERDEQCLNANEWQLGIALGIGFTSNPLVDGDNIPLLVLPDIAWYGETFYFDNGELGYQWLDGKKSSFVTYLNVDKERAFFTFWHPANILLPLNRFNQVTAAEDPNQSGPEQLPISIDDVGRRNWALMGGGRWYYRPDNAEWQLSLEKDLSATHNGEKLEISYQHFWQWSSFHFSTQVKMTWKSSALVDYYYGLDEHDKVDPSYFYQASSGWQPAVGLTLQKKIQNNWLWLTRVSLQKLHSGMTNSPLVEERNIFSVFSGFAYQF
ncbi:MipA/OmpV family protein [Paraglaciecola sp. 25GB23A]|uniref:MipA/OmpV family protein n=1 Tax=Paraglaciecola sp. 25GB23A TaxID=3156068 RepID=UPI0032AED5CB